MKNTKLLILKVSWTLFITFGFLVVTNQINASISDSRDTKLKSTETTKNPYAPGEIIIKFKDESLVGELADQMIDATGSTFKNVTENDNLDKLNKKHRVKAFKRIFNHDKESKSKLKDLKLSLGGKFNKTQAINIQKESHKKYNETIKKIHAKRQAQAEKRGKRGSIVSKETPKVPYLDNIYKVEMDAGQSVEAACEEYKKDPNVEFCQPNYKMQVQWIPNDPYYTSRSSWGQSYDDLWGLKKMEMGAAWDITKGAGIVVAVVDTGVDYAHPDIAANIWSNTDEIPNNSIDDDHNGFVDDVRGWDFGNSDNNPMDVFGHGTHCAGTIAAVGNNSIGIIGVAPQAKIMPVKGFTDAGEGFAPALLASIKYAVDNGADVVSNSWGPNQPMRYDPIKDVALQYAYNLGAVLVFSAGNNRADVAEYYPANNAHAVITVAASSELDKRSPFSNIGSLIDVAAPGGGDYGIGANYYINRNILSLRARNTNMYDDSAIVGTQYYRSWGTSMACPHVAGLAALILSKHPEFTPDDVTQVIRASADDIETPGFDILSGSGRVNARKALLINTIPRVKILSPSKPYDIGNLSTVTITGDAYGSNFLNYQLYYATLDKRNNTVPYDPLVGPWIALGAASSQSVQNGVLTTVNSGSFIPGQYYLLKLEVTTADGRKYNDVREMVIYKNDPNWVKIKEDETGRIFSFQSEGENFAWIEYSGTYAITKVIKFYSGAKNQYSIIYPDNRDSLASGISKFFFTPDYLVWQEDRNGKVIKIARIVDYVTVVVLREFIGSDLLHVDQNKVLMKNGSETVFIHDIVANLSTSFSLSSSDNLQLSGNSISYVNGSGPNGPGFPPLSEIKLYDISSHLSNSVKILNWKQDQNFNYCSNLLNFSTALVWVENHQYESRKLMTIFDKQTKLITQILEDSSVESISSNGKDIIYQKMNWINVFSRGLYIYNINTKTTSPFADSKLRYDLVSNEEPYIGSKHTTWIQKKDPWLGNNILFTSNNPPTLTSLSNKAILANQLYTLTVNATDPESDKIDISAVGGTWPNSATALPAGATFVDNGNGTGVFRWTPTALGVYTVSFLARDFAERKYATWKTVKTITITVEPFAVDMSANPASGSVPVYTQFDITPPANGSLYTVSMTYGDGVSSQIRTGVSSKTSFGHAYRTPGTYTATAKVTNSAGKIVTRSKTISVTGNTSLIGWTAYDQAPDYTTWTSIGGLDNSTFRLLIQGSKITKSGIKLRLRFKGTTAYAVKKVSVVKRDGSTLNGVDATFKQVTFGSNTWEAGGNVPANGVLYSNWIPFTVTPGQDIFVTLWSPSGNGMIPYLYNTSGATLWTTLEGVDKSNVIDWAGGLFPLISAIVDGVEVIEVSN